MALPPIQPGQGFNVDFRQKYPAGSTGTQSKVMLSRILRYARKYVDPKHHLTGGPANGTVGHQTVGSTATTSEFFRTQKLEGPQQFPRPLTTPSNATKTIFVAFANPTRYAAIDAELDRLIAGGHLEILQTVLVP